MDAPERTQKTSYKTFTTGYNNNNYHHCPFIRSQHSKCIEFLLTKTKSGGCEIRTHGPFYEPAV